MQTMKRRASGVGALALSVILTAGSALQAQVGIQEVGAPTNGGASVAYGVSGDGQVVVGYQTTVVSAGPPPVLQYEAFRWTIGGGRIGLGDLSGGSFESRAFGVNSDGSVIVGFSSSANGYEAFRWTGAGMVGLGDLAGGIFNSSASGVSGDGNAIAGYGFSTGGLEAFVWRSPGPVTGLGDLPGGIFSSSATGISADGSTVVGTSISASGSEAFKWTQAGGMVGLGDLAGGDFSSRAAAASASGSVIVGSGASAAGIEAVRWGSGGMVSLGDLPGGAVSAAAAAVSADGNVIVGTGTTADGQRAFIWDPASGMRELGPYLASLGVNMTGWRLDAATGISADGTTIVGFGQSPTTTTTGWVARVPAFCYVNCDGSVAVPVLNVNDFVCFLNRFAAGDSYANCDGSTIAPVLNVNDFICFQTKFAQGCP